jgi:predicted transcriptional regulator
MLKFLEGESKLTMTVVELALVNSKRTLASDVFLPCLSPLSAEDKRFLKAMAEDSEASRVKDISERLGVGKTHVQTYRKRLIEADVIHSPSRGTLAFSIPYLGQYLRGEI